MYKIIDLGHEFAGTGEPRARLLGPSLVKTASSAIQEYWNTLSHSDEFAYLWVIGVSAMEYYGCNNNGDAFHEEDLKKTIPDWAVNANIFVHHVNKDPKKGIGKPVFAWYNDDMHRVELVLAVRRNAEGAQAIVDRIASGEQMYVSMGCNVAYDVCSICGHQSKTRAEYCDHLRFNLKKILPDGRQIYAINPNPKFFDISIVTKPADPMAFSLDKIASDGIDYHATGSAELGEESLSLMRKAASVRKLADMIKQVDGKVVASKCDPLIRRLRDIEREGLDELDYPEIPYRRLERAGLGPYELMAALSCLGSPATFRDAWWMSGLPRIGLGFGEALRAMPSALYRLADMPDMLHDILGEVLGRNHECASDPDRITTCITIVRPAVTRRIEILKSIPGLDKCATSMPNAAGAYGDENFRTLEFQDVNGNRYRTTPYHLERGVTDNKLKRGVLNAITMAGLAGAVFSPDILTGLLSAGMAGAAAFCNTEPSTVADNFAYEVPVGTFNDAWKQRVTKTASMLDVSKIKFGTRVGMIAPFALALDYIIAKRRANNAGYAEPDPNSWMHTLGKEVMSHPVLSAGIGAVAGAGVHNAVASAGKYISRKLR